MDTSVPIPTIPMMEGKLAISVKFKDIDKIFVCLTQNNSHFQHGQEYTREDLLKLKEYPAFLAFKFPSIETAIDFAKSFYLDPESKILIRNSIQKRYNTYLKSQSVK